MLGTGVPGAAADPGSAPGAAVLQSRWSWGRDHAKAKACASDIAKAINVEAAATNDPAALVRDSQLVVTTTPAREPILKAAWLHPGLHITAMGSDQAGKNEIEPVAIAEELRAEHELGSKRPAAFHRVDRGERDDGPRTVTENRVDFLTEAVHERRRPTVGAPGAQRIDRMVAQAGQAAEHGNREDERRMTSSFLTRQEAC